MTRKSMELIRGKMDEVKKVVAGTEASNMATRLAIMGVSLYPVHTGGKVSNFRLGITPADKSIMETIKDGDKTHDVHYAGAEELTLTVAMIENKHKEHEGEYVLDPLQFEANGSPVYYGHCWANREHKRSGAPGTQILRGIPFKPLEDLVQAFGATLKDKEMVEALGEENLWNISKPTQTATGMRQLRTLGIVLDQVPEKLREITIYGLVKPDGEVEFEVSRQVFCIGTQPNNVKSTMRGAREGQNSISSGAIPINTASGVANPKLLSFWQETVKEAVRLVKEQNKLEKILVEVRRENRQSWAETQRQKVLNERYNYGTTTTPKVADRIEEDGSEVPVNEEIEAGNEVIQFDA